MSSEKVNVNDDGDKNIKFYLILNNINSLNALNHYYYDYQDVIEIIIQKLKYLHGKIIDMRAAFMDRTKVIFLFCFIILSFS